MWVEATTRLNTLQHLRFNPEARAGRGAHGEGSNRTGKSGGDVVIYLPIGSSVRNRETEAAVVDLTEDGQRYMVARGGRGGQGNQHYATATRQAPRFAQDGEAGEEIELQVELKLMADVGLVGLPNAGKSTLVSVVSAARPKIADYAFTTLAPMLGVVAVDNFETFVIADIPGLIEGAHEGHGLGDRFLRHVERCSVLLHLVDLSSDDPTGAMDVIVNELTNYSPALGRTPRMIGGSKLDSATDENRSAVAEYAASRGLEYCEFSSVTGAGIRELVFALHRLVKRDAGEHEVGG